MAIVNPVRKKEDILRVHELLMKHQPEIHADIWQYGVNVAMRISDLVSITQEEAIAAISKGGFNIKEEKTKKYRTLRLNEKAKIILTKRIDQYPDDVYVFQSQSNRAKGLQQPIHRISVYRIIREIGKIINVDMGTHSMRKTRGCMLYYHGGFTIEEISKMLNHSNPAVTMAYIGITQERINETYEMEL